MIHKTSIKRYLAIFIRILLKCFAIFSVLTVIWTGWLYTVAGYGQTPAAFDFATYLLFWNPELIRSNGQLLFSRMIFILLFNSLFWGIVYFAYRKINAKKGKKIDEQ